MFVVYVFKLRYLLLLLIFVTTTQFLVTMLSRNEHETLRSVFRFQDNYDHEITIFCSNTVTKDMNFFSKCHEYHWNLDNIVIDLCVFLTMLSRNSVTSCSNVGY